MNNRNLTKKKSYSFSQNTNSASQSSSSRETRVTNVETNTYNRPVWPAEGIRYQNEKTPTQRSNEVAKSRFLHTAPTHSANQPSTSGPRRIHSLHEKPVTNRIDAVPLIANTAGSRPVAGSTISSTTPVTTSAKPQQKNFLFRFFSSFKSKELKPKPGYALIFNNQKFNVKGVELLPRTGSQHDVAKLKEIFNEFNIETHVKNDLTLSQIKQKVKSLSRKDFSKFGCFIIVILTHGTGKELFAKDKNYDFIDVIEDPVVLINKSLLNMPKVFILQRSLDKTDVIMPIETVQTDSGAVTKRNIFKCHAFHYNQSVDAATVFVEKLSGELKSRGKYLNINDLMMHVNNEVGNTDVPQLPYIESTLIFPIFGFKDLL